MQSFCRMGVVVQESILVFRSQLADLQNIKGFLKDEKGC